LQPSRDQFMSRWPNLFIVGAPKAGTTSLHSYLQSFPAIYMSRIKEPNFFSRIAVPDGHPVRPIRDARKYLQLFDGATTERFIGEASPTYLADPEAPRLIHEAAPDARILISLRDPVERAYSHYLMMRNNGTTRLSFLAEFQRGLAMQDDRQLVLLRPDVGLYRAQVERYLGVFGASQVQVILFEELIADVRGTLRQVLKFLEVNDSIEHVVTDAQRAFGEARGPLVRYLFANRTIARLGEILISPAIRKRIREKLLVKNVAKPVMEQDARRFIADFYRQDVWQLGVMMGRSLPWKNFIGIK
jgi:Sulfotransferase family